MRIFRNPITVAMSMWLATATLVFCLFSGCGGCVAGRGTYSPPTGTNTTGTYDTNALADVVVVTAENTRTSALEVFRALMEFEKNHDAALRALNPGIHTFAEQVRRESKGWLDDLSAARTAYQIARTPENASKLRSAWAMVDSMLSSAAKHLAAASTVKAP
jgi:hypothetical protein